MARHFGLNQQKCDPGVLEFARFLRGTAAGRMPAKPREKLLRPWASAALAGFAVGVSIFVVLLVLAPALVDWMGSAGR
jgi:hypothetical protein